MTVHEAAASLGVSTKTIRRWSDAGKLPHGRTPTGYRVFDVAVIEELARQMLGRSDMETPPEQSPGGAGQPSPGDSREVCD